MSLPLYRLARGRGILPVVTVSMTGHGSERAGHALRVAGRAVIVAFLLAAPARALPAGSSTASQALALCEYADGASGDAKAQALARGIALAEEALAADPKDALAHFATVCDLGKQMEASGLGLSQLLSVRRLRREMDVTLELAPNDPDALAAKGALLLRLPRWFGGDPVQAEALLRRAVAAEPSNDAARCYLAQALHARGAEDEARALLPHC